MAYTQRIQKHDTKATRKSKFGKTENSLIPELFAELVATWDSGGLSNCCDTALPNLVIMIVYTHSVGALAQAVTKARTL